MNNMIQLKKEECKEQEQIPKEKIIIKLQKRFHLTREKARQYYRKITRACLKIAFRQMCVTLCGRFGPNERGVVGCVKRIWSKYTAKRGVQMAGMNFQTRSSVHTHPQE